MSAAKLWRCKLHLLLVLLDVLSQDGFWGGVKGRDELRAEPPACFYAVAALRTRCFSELSLQALPASLLERLKFERLLFCLCRNGAAEGGNGNVRGDRVMSVLHHHSGISECWKDVKCKTHHWVE